MPLYGKAKYAQSHIFFFFELDTRLTRTSTNIILDYFTAFVFIEAAPTKKKQSDNADENFS